VASGNVDHDGDDEILTGAGPGAIFGAHVRGFETNGRPLQGLSFLAYGTSKWGVNAAGGNIEDDRFDEVITGAGPGAVFGPHVRAFDFDGAPPVTPVPGVNFMAYGSRQWGVNIAAGDIDGDGFDEIVTGPGPGVLFGPHVRGWDVDGSAVRPIPGVSYFAYATRAYGAVVGCGDLDDRDGDDEIATAPGPGADLSASIRLWNYDGAMTYQMGGGAFTAWEPSQAAYGARVSSGDDLVGEGRCFLIVGVGPDPAASAGPQVKVYLYDDYDDDVEEKFSFMAYPSSWPCGVNVAGGRF
jgi:hypothetical protein